MELNRRPGREQRRLVRHSRIAVVAVATIALAAAAAAQDYEVTKADPATAVQATSGLDIVITGKRFERGVAANFYVTGTTDPGGITVNSTTYKNPRRLIANIDVAPDADVDSFDVEISLHRRRGKGIELFSVQKGPKEKPYTFTDLGERLDNLRAIDNSGRMVGWDSEPGQRSRAVLVQVDGLGNVERTHLSVAGESARSYDINQAGQVVGYDTRLGGGFAHAYLLIPEDTDGDEVPDLWFRDDDSDDINDLMIDLGTWPGETASGAEGVSEPGANGYPSVVGWIRMGASGRHAALWTFDDLQGVWVITDLGTLTLRGHDQSEALDVNSSGWIVGNSSIGCCTDKQAIIWQPDGSGGIRMVELGTLGGPQSGAVAINELGQVVGFADTDLRCGSGPCPIFHAVRWDVDVLGLFTTTDLGSFGSFSSLSRAFDINELGQIVGDAHFLYEADAMSDLNDLVDVPKEFTLGAHAYAINDSGQIVVRGRKKVKGKSVPHGILLNPR